MEPTKIEETIARCLFILTLVCGYAAIFAEMGALDRPF